MLHIQLSGTTNNHPQREDMAPRVLKDKNYVVQLKLRWNRVFMSEP